MKKDKYYYNRLLTKMFQMGDSDAGLVLYFRFSPLIISIHRKTYFSKRRGKGGKIAFSVKDKQYTVCNEDLLAEMTVKFFEYIKEYNFSGTLLGYLRDRLEWCLLNFVMKGHKIATNEIPEKDCIDFAIGAAGYGDNWDWDSDFNKDTPLFANLSLIKDERLLNEIEIETSRLSNFLTDEELDLFVSFYLHKKTYYEIAAEKDIHFCTAYNRIKSTVSKIKERRPSYLGSYFRFNPKLTGESDEQTDN